MREGRVFFHLVKGGRWGKVDKTISLSCPHYNPGYWPPALESHLRSSKSKAMPLSSGQVCPESIPHSRWCSSTWIPYPNDSRPAFKAWRRFLPWLPTVRPHCQYAQNSAQGTDDKREGMNRAWTRELECPWTCVKGSAAHWYLGWKES